MQVSYIPHHYLSTWAFWIVYLFYDFKAGWNTRPVYFSISRPFIFEGNCLKETGIHSFIKYLFSTYSKADIEYTVVGEKKKGKVSAFTELINLVGERE